MFRRCLCWLDLKTAAAVVAVFSLATSAIQILTTATVFAAKSEAGFNFSAYNTTEQAVMGLYIGLSVLDLINIVFAIVLMIGLEQGLNAKTYMRPWLVFAIILMIYELATNVFFFYMAFDYRNDGKNLFGIAWISYIVVPLAYYAVKLIILIYGYMGVYSYYRLVSKERQYVKSQIMEDSGMAPERRREPRVIDRYYDDDYDRKTRDRYDDVRYSSRDSYYAHNPYRY